jgi:CubicO group peptidase (beta-lactamase class C family)
MNERFEALRDVLGARDSGIRAFVVLQHGRPVFEHYRADVGHQDLQSVNSVTKSVVGMLVGIALHEGALRDLRQTIGEFLPEARDPAIDARVRRITIEQLLTMTSGFEWNEREVDDCLLGRCSPFEAHHARLRFILSRPLAHEPGTHFEYDSHATHLLSVVLARASGCGIDEYARTKLFEPLGIDQFEWLADEDGYPFASHGLKLPARAMAGIGLVMGSAGIARGLTGEVRLIDESFVTQATRAHSEGGWPIEESHYGYLWWIAPRAYFAAGFGEQFLIVERARSLVIAVSCDSGKARKNVWQLYHDYV